MHFSWSESIKGGIVGGVHGDELTEKMGRNLGDLDAVLPGDSSDLIAIILRAGSLNEIEETGVR